MTIEQADVVDYVGIDRESGNVVLTIVDNISWDDVIDHLAKLQVKINCYIAFYESGELLQSYPDSKDRRLVISILSAFPLSDDARAVEAMDRVRSVLSSIDVDFTVKALDMTDGPGV